MKVLLVEDDARDIDLTRRELARAAPHLSLLVATTLGEARALLAESAPCDLVLTDLNLPDGSGLQLVAEIRARALPLVVVVLTGSDSADAAVAALKAGADDFLVKRDDYLQRLPAVLDTARLRFQTEAARRARPLRVLYAEDSAIDIDLTRRHLASHAPNIGLEVVNGVAELLHRLPISAEDPCPCDVLLLDYRLAGLDALDVLRTLRDERRLDLPVVLVTGEGDGEVAAQAFRFGAANYLVKHPGYLFELPAVLESAHDRAQLAREQAALRASEADLRAIADNASVGILVNFQGRHVFANRHIAQMLGYDAVEELLDTTLDGVIHPDARAEVAERFHRRMAGENVPPQYESIALRKDGQGVPVEIRGTLTRWNGQPAGMVFMSDISERKRAEEALRESEERARLVFEQSPVTLSLATLPEGKFVEVNDAFARQFGYPREEALGRTTLELGMWSDPAARDRFLAEFARSGKVSNFESNIRRRDGESATILMSGSVLKLRGQAYSLVSAVDITERKLTERALMLLSTGLVEKRGAAFFEEVALRLADLLQVEICFVGGLVDSEHRRVRTLGMCIDKQIAAPVEYDPAGTPCETVIGKKVAIFPEGVQALFPADRFLVDLGVESYAAVPMFDSNGSAIGHVGVMGRKPLHHPERVDHLLRLFAVRTAAEIERQRDQTRFQDLFEFSPDAIIIVNQQGFVTLANRRAESLFGYSHDELIGLPVDDLMPQSDKAGHAAARRQYAANPVPRSMGSRSADLRARRKDGTSFAADISLSPMHSDEGMLVVATVRDVTERKQAEARRQALEAQLFQSQKMEAIGTLSGGIAHDFNNILSAIIGNVALARQDVGSDHPALESLTEIGKASDRAKDLVQQILTFSRRQAQQRRAIALPPVIEEVVKLMRATLPAGIHLATAFGADAAKTKALADPTQIHQVVMNLCTNAWHAMKNAAGSIDIGLEQIKLDAGEIRGDTHLPPGPYIHLSVRDTGCGMDAATLARIFEPFYTTKQVGQGTGLGLSVVHGIMQTHEGAVGVDSRPGEGSTFHLYFPALEVDAETVEVEDQAATESAGRGQHVLYVDDDEALVFMVTRMLERQGYRVSGHTWAKDALDMLRADPHQFDLVVTDYNMPGLSGLDLMREVRAIRADLPVALTSGYITDELRQQAAESGVRHLIYKPNTVSELCEAVRTLTNETRK